MLAPNVAATATEKRRTITLTNRAPIQIVEDQWPIIAQGSVGSDDSAGPPWGWEMSFYVRRNSKHGRHIIHAKFSTYDETDENNERLNQLVRVGRILTQTEAMNSLWKEMVAVGEELRSRIFNEHMHKYVTAVVDKCFADLKPELTVL